MVHIDVWNSADPQKIIDLIPDDVKPYVCLNLSLSCGYDKEKNVFRQTHLSSHGRNENDAEHAWHMAVMAYLLREYSNSEIDIAKTMLMCLIHDIVGI